MFSSWYRALICKALNIRCSDSPNFFCKILIQIRTTKLGSYACCALAITYVNNPFFHSITVCTMFDRPYLNYYFTDCHDFFINRKPLCRTF